MGPGLALMYDAGLEVLRSSDRQILTELSDARVIRAVARSMDQVLPLIGAASVTAVELALDDPAFRERLKARAGELTTSYVQNWPSGNCEFCEITIQDSDGTVETRCGTEDECRAAGGIIVVLIGVLILKWLWDQIF